MSDIQVGSSTDLKDNFLEDCKDGNHEDFAEYLNDQLLLGQWFFWCDF